MAKSKECLISKGESEDPVSTESKDQPPGQSQQIQIPAKHDADAAKELGLIGNWQQIYCVSTGQWFTPLSRYNILRDSTTAKFCKIAFWLYQLVVFVLMWVYFAYAMGFLGPRTLKNLDWLCTITDIKNILYSARWAIYQHFGVWYFAKGHLEQLLRELEIKAEDCKQRGYVNFTTLFIGGAIVCLIAFPLSLHTAQMIIPDFEPRPRLLNGKVLKMVDDPFPWWQIFVDALAFLLQRLCTFPILFVFVYVVLFHRCEVEMLCDEILRGNYKEHANYLDAWNKYRKIMDKIRNSETVFQPFLIFFITTLLLLSVLEVFSVIEKVETHMLYNHTVLLTPSTAMYWPASHASTDFSATKAHFAFPTRLTGKHAYPYFVVLLNAQGGNATGMSTQGPLEKIITAVYKLSVREIIICAVQDVAVNIVLYSFPLYQISKLQDSINHLVHTVEYSTCKEDGTDGYTDNSFATRKDKKNLLKLMKSTGNGIRIMNQTVSILNTMLITLVGPFITVVLNLMFKHIHIEPPLRG